jgi:A/G-specific adenine glycosylase
MPATEPIVNTLTYFNRLSDSDKLSFFRSTIWKHYKEHSRQFTWRQTTDPYHIFVSEVMLQQTQTFRVAPKYEAFIAAFPTFEALAQAPFEHVLSYWKGLGYNRRALNLQRAAQIVVNQYNGILPDDPLLIDLLPGIGAATASSICAFAFNKSTVFIETNIRAVFIHFFFQSSSKVHDNEIRPLVAQTVSQENPRHWYYALMDYGAMLKKNFGNPSRKSKHHAKQSSFEGSDRQIRGLILHHLLEKKHLSINEFLQLINQEPARIERQLAALLKDGLIKTEKDLFSINS